MRTPFVSAVEMSLEHLLHFPRLNEIYDQVQHLSADLSFVDRCLQVLNVRCEIAASDLDRIPRTGPLVVVANHPFGAIEGLALASVLSKTRPDVRIMANYLLGRMPELHEVMLFVDPFGSRESVARNLGAMRQALRWVEGGGLLGVFPAGEVAHLKLRNRAVSEPPWSANIARIIRKTKAAVLPIFFCGHNGPLFQMAGLVHPRLRTALLPHELLNKQRSTLVLRVGTVIPAVRIQQYESDATLIDYLRLRTLALGDHIHEKPAPERRFFGIKTKPPEPESIVEAVNPRILAWEISRLPQRQTLISNNDLDVIYFRARQSPHLLQEIGRLREITFRLANEGTGKATDLDRFDEDYIHLLVWHRGKNEIVGAYRLGPTDEILPRKGVKGLYTSTLFDYSQHLMEQLSPAIELGRSFVRPEYQKSFAPLLLLWKGVGHFVVRRPRYRIMFGPVSINSEYHSLSKQLIIQFLEATRSHDGLAPLIRPKNPPRRRPADAADLKTMSTAAKDFEEVSTLVSEIERDGKGVPVLLRQYLKLNARLLGFNVDPDFGDVLDGLMMVDLTKVDRHILVKYMGREGLASFLHRHRDPLSESAETPAAEHLLAAP